MPVKRLWISSMEDTAIREGFRNLKSAEVYRNLADASVCRAQADWLVGMNASRAFTKVYDYRLSVGRVQTPTLAMLVDRENEIANFHKQQYFMTHLLVESMGKTIDAVSERFTDQEEANRLAGICRGRMATVPSIERQNKTAAPPKLYDLTTLQRDANRLFGYTAAKTLACAQSLYENKLITYPRTDSNYLTDDMEQTAQMAERDAIKYKRVEFMEDKIGNEYEAHISGIQSYGIYCEIDENHCEGMVPMRDLDDDYYDFDERNYCLVGRRHHHKYQLGDPVRIKVARANLEKRQLDFILAE